MVNEIWRDVKGYEGLYQVSNLGRVKSIKKSMLMRPCDNGNGYKIVFLRKNGTRKAHYIHRLVAEHFIEQPSGKNYVNHKNYDITNNTATNLEWCTQKENIWYSRHRMQHRKRVTHTNTGEKYITYKESEKVYRLIIDRKEYRFKQLEDAIKVRDKILNETV